MTSVKDMVGIRFGRLTVHAEAGRTKNRQALWTCVCECGESIVVTGDSLRRGKTQSCGCLQRDRTSSKNSKHGLSSSPEYGILKGIIQRCTNPSREAFERYGGRGIKVCARWLHGEGGKSGFELFLADMGQRPSIDHSIDRVDNDGDYGPGNCRWATPTCQARNQKTNRIVQIDGEAMSLAEACERRGVSYKTAWDRLNRGWEVETALSRHFSEQGLILTNPEDLKNRRAA